MIQQSNNKHQQQYPHHINSYNKHHFTQLSLISQLLSIKIHQYLNHKNLHIYPHKINQEGDICIFDIIFQCWENDNQSNNQNKQRTSEKRTQNTQQQHNIKQNKKQLFKHTINKQMYKYTIHITIIQIQGIIKFHIIYKQIQTKYQFQQYKQKQQKYCTPTNSHIHSHTNSNCLDHSHLHSRENHNYPLQLTKQKMQKLRLHILKRQELYIDKQKQQSMINQAKQPQTHINILSKQQYEFIDQFWIKYKNYLPKKIYQSYLLSDLESVNNFQKSAKLIYIFEQRIIKPIIQKVQQIEQISHKNRQNTQFRQHIEHDPINNKHLQANIQKLTSKQMFITIISNNFRKIFKYLTPKQYKNLQISNRQIYKILHSQKCCKIIYEDKWGKTGFDLEQKNWIKLYQNKTLENQKNKKIKYVGFRWN